EWRERAASAALVLGAGGDAADQPSQQVQLLTDIRAAFGDEHTIFTEALLSFLNGLDESPWGARRRGEGLDPRGLADLLRPFGIKPKKVRRGEEVRKGYHLDQFSDAFERHLPPLREGEHGATRGTSAPLSQADVPHVPPVSPSGEGDQAPGTALVTRRPTPDHRERLALIHRPID